MSWWQKALALGEEEGRVESKQEGALAKGGVREDLSELTQSFSRGLRGSKAFGLVKGFGNFLAGEPLEEGETSEVESQGEEEALSENVAQEGETSKDVRVEIDREGEAAEALSEDVAEGEETSQDVRVERQRKEDLVEDSKQPEVPADSEQAPPKMRGLKADMSELTGTLSSSISRFSRVIKVVTGEDLLPKAAPGSLQVSASTSDSEVETSVKTPRGGAQKDLQVLTGSIASGFSKLASHLPDMLSLVSKGEEEIDAESVGVTEGVVAFATSIASHPETWLDFPLSTDETAQDLTLTELQEDHVYILEQDAPQIAAIRNELCPAFMSEERFWRVYFVLLASRLGTSQAVQLLTPDILAERKLLLDKLRKERGPLAEDAYEEGSKANEVPLQSVEEKGQGKDKPKDKSKLDALSPERASEALHQPAETGKPASEAAPSVKAGPLDEEEVDDWLDDEDDNGGQNNGQDDPPETEESSFSDLDEEQEGASKDVVPVLKTKAGEGHSDAPKGTGWVQLHRTASQGLKTVSSSSDFEHEEGSPGSPAATSTSHPGSRTDSESGNEWLTVDAEDGRSAVS